jgi:hypothetical protein
MKAQLLLSKVLTVSKFGRVLVVFHAPKVEKYTATARIDRHPASDVMKFSFSPFCIIPATSVISHQQDTGTNIAKLKREEQTQYQSATRTAISHSEILNTLITA